MQKELCLYNIDKDYLKFLHSIDYRVSVKYNHRPFIGIVTMINGIPYALPLTSQTTSERAKQGKKKRASRVTTFIRDGKDTEIANILHNNMIPLIDGTYNLISVDASVDTYEANEIRFIRKHREKIINKAQKVHDDRIQKPDRYLSMICCDFSLLEQRCHDFKK